MRILLASIVEVQECVDEQYRMGQIQIVTDSESHYDKQYSLAYLNSQGNIPDRQAVAKLQTADDRLKADLARAEFNRVKQKMKMLSDQATMTAVMGRQVEMLWKHG